MEIIKEPSLTTSSRIPAHEPTKISKIIHSGELIKIPAILTLRGEQIFIALALEGQEIQYRANKSYGLYSYIPHWLFPPFISYPAIAFKLRRFYCQLVHNTIHPSNSF